MSAADDAVTGGTIAGPVGAIIGGGIGALTNQSKHGFANSKFLRNFAAQFAKVLGSRATPAPSPGSSPPPTSAAPPPYSSAPWQTSPDTQWECQTDTECDFQDCIVAGGMPWDCANLEKQMYPYPEDWEGESYPGGPQKIPKNPREWYYPGSTVQAFVPPAPFPTVDPNTVGAAWEVAKAIPPWLWNVLLPGLIFWPSETADDDVIYPRRTPTFLPKVEEPTPMPYPMPQRRKPGGPGPKVRKEPRPIVIGPYAVPENRPRPGDYPKPARRPAPAPGPAPGTATPIPAPAPVPSPKTWPAPASPPVPRPAPAPAPTGTPSLWPTLLTLALPSLLPQPGRITRPRSGRREDTAPDPLTQFQPQPLPYERDVCQCDKPRKRGKKRCSNPIVSKRKSTRGGSRYVTTTRRIECQA